MTRQYHITDTAAAALVTGGSSGIGRAVCKSLAEKGIRVYEFSRTGTDNGNIHHVSVDVTDEACVRGAVGGIIAAEGKIDILINCAGFGIGGAAEFTQVCDAKKQFDVNFFGMVRVTGAVLPHMRKAGCGRIINVSSVAASVPIPFQAFYSASKAAVNSYTGALANEVRPYGITVCAVMPGDISTGFTKAREKNTEGDAEYGGRIGRSLAKMEHDEINGMSPAVCGRYIAKVALKKHVKPYYSVGFVYKLLCVLIKILPARFAGRVLYGLYAK